jgi:hypothetical protein
VPTATAKTGDILKATRVEVPKSALALQDFQEVSFSCAFEIKVTSANKQTAEEWLRAVQEGSPTPLRWFVVGGWIAGLGLRLDLRSKSDHILGWRIMHAVPSEIVIRVEGPALSGRQVLQVDDGSVTHTTVVHYNRAAAKLLWTVAAPIHVRVIPYRLRRVAQAFV